MYRILYIVLYLILLSGCEKNAASVAFVSEDEEICYNFILNNMIEDGGVHTNYIDMPYNENFATGYEVLSESQGLLMHYTVAIKDKATFETVLNFTLKNLNSKKLIRYRYNSDGKEFNVNAAIDDLRIIRALMDGSKIFDNSQYKSLAQQLAQRFYDTNTKDGYLYDLYDSDIGIKNEFITLCYIDLDTIDKLSAYDEKWDTIYKNMLGIIEGGYINDEFPMFKTNYNYSNKTYGETQNINMVESLLTALHLSTVEKCPPATILYIHQRIKAGDLYGHYNQSGDHINTLQSTAIYAICAMIGMSENNIELYNDSIARMNQFIVTEKDSCIYGAFGNMQTLEVYSFDNLMALTAYRAIE